MESITALAKAMSHRKLAFTYDAKKDDDTDDKTDDTGEDTDVPDSDDADADGNDDSNSGADNDDDLDNSDDDTDDAGAGDDDGDSDNTDAETEGAVTDDDNADDSGDDDPDADDAAGSGDSDPDGDGTDDDSNEDAGESEKTPLIEPIDISSFQNYKNLESTDFASIERFTVSCVRTLAFLKLKFSNLREQMGETVGLDRNIVTSVIDICSDWIKTIGDFEPSVTPKMNEAQQTRTAEFIGTTAQTLDNLINIVSQAITRQTSGK